MTRPEGGGPRNVVVPPHFWVLLSLAFLVVLLGLLFPPLAVLPSSSFGWCCFFPSPLVNLPFSYVFVFTNNRCEVGGL